MTELELLQDLNLAARYLNQMKDAASPDELNRVHSMLKKKIEEVYRDKKQLLKEAR